MSLFLGLKNQAKWRAPFHLASFKEAELTSSNKDMGLLELANSCLPKGDLR